MSQKQKHFDYSPLYVKKTSIHFPIVLILVIVISSMFITALTHAGWVYALGLFTGFGILLVTGVRAIFHSRQTMAKLYLGFSAANNFSYFRRLESAHEESSIPELSNKHVLNNVLAGSYAGFDFRMFDHVYGGRNKVAVYVTAVDLPHAMPNMVIDSLLNGVGTSAVLPDIFDSHQKISLEGDFNKYFSLYVPHSSSKDLVLLLAPDVMLALLKSGAKSDIEFIDNKMYIYLSGSSDMDISIVEQMGELITLVIDEIGAKLRRFDTASFSSEVAHTQPIVQPVLKRRNPRLMALIPTVFFGCLLYAMFTRNRLIYFFPLVFGASMVLIFSTLAFNAYRVRKKQEDLRKNYLDRP